MPETPSIAHCPHCLETHPAQAHFCTHCGMPLTFYATTAPLESVWALGWLINRLLEQHPSRAVLVGTWIFALPGALVFIPGGASVLLGELSSLAAVIPSACYLLLAVRVTIAYVRGSGLDGDEGPRCPECGYLLCLLTSDRCPECGAAVPAGERCEDPGG